jgi:hypothetical protein
MSAFTTVFLPESANRQIGKSAGLVDILNVVYNTNNSESRTRGLIIVTARCFNIEIKTRDRLKKDWLRQERRPEKARAKQRSNRDFAFRYRYRGIGKT